MTDGYKLISLKDQQEILSGSMQTTHRGEFCKVTGFKVPEHEGSTGRVYVMFGDGSTASYYPAVIDCRIVKA